MASIPVLVVMWCFAQTGTFGAPGYHVQTSGVWYAEGSASSAMPLGTLGSGYIDLTAGGTFGSSTAENTWLKPQDVPGQAGITLQVDGRKVDLLPGTKPLNTLRFWGHFPMADLDFGPAFGDALVYMRAFAPFIPHDYTLSATPVALFRCIVMNRGSSPVPVEIGIQWQDAAPSGKKSQGNVEGVLSWHHDTLAPGDVWRISPEFVFGASRDQVAQRVLETKPGPAPLVGKPVPEGKAYAFGAVTDFLLDGLGGFNWETHRRESAVFSGAPNIGQIFWNLNYGDQSAGRGPDGGYGLKGTTLPTRTKDGKLEVRLSLVPAGPDGVALVFAVLNLSNEPVNGLDFGFAVNADIGGPAHAEHQHAEYDDEQIHGAVFVDQRTGVVLALAGQPDKGMVGTWPQAHAAMAANRWPSQEKASAAPEVATAANCIQVKNGRGSYAVGVMGGANWAIEHVRKDGGIYRAQAVTTLPAGENTELTLGLAWYFPTWTSSDGEQLRHRYAKLYDDAAGVLAVAMPKASEIENKIVAWQEPIYASVTPPFLKDALVNGLYVMARNSWWMDDGRFFQSESFTGCPITETFVCRFNGSFPLAVLFPECEKATMRSVAAAQAPTGEIPFGFGSPMGSRSPMFQIQHPIVSPEFVLTTWRDYVLWKDRAYLDAMYARCQAAMHYAMTLDTDHDGVVNEHPGNEKGFPANQYYDIWPWWGTSAYTGSIWLAALRAGEEMAKIEGDKAFAEEMRRWFDAGSKSFYAKLWTGAYYRLYNDPERKRVSNTSLTNALCGQWYAYATGLGEIVPAATIPSEVDTVFRWNVAATPYGAVNGVRPNGRPDETFPDHSAVITIGEVWNFCALAAYAGRKEDAMRLFVDSYSNILLRQRTPWNIPWSLDRTTGAIKWGVNYYSNPCVWTLFQALDPAAYALMAKPAP